MIPTVFSCFLGLNFGTFCGAVWGFYACSEPFPLPQGGAVGLSLVEGHSGVMGHTHRLFFYLITSQKCL